MLNIPPKILFVLHLPPPIHGAAMVGKYIRESEVVKEAFRTCFVNLSTSRSLNDIGKGGLAKFWRYIQIVNKSLTKYLKFKPELVYLTLNSHGTGFYKDAILVLLLKAFGARMVYHLHNKGVQDYSHKRLDNFLYKRIFRNAEVILLSKNLYADIQKYVPVWRLHICPNGIPEKHLAPIDQNRERDIKLLFISNLYKAKGPLTLIEACKILNKKGLPFQCHIVGKEGDISKEQLRNAIEDADLGGKVTYLGAKYGDEKEKILARASVFCFPSENECFPLVLLEAMAFGLPVVSTSIGGIPDLVVNQQTGFLVLPNDPEELANRLEILIQDPQLRLEMGYNGRKRFENQFTLDHFEKRFTQILQNILRDEPVGV